jgi:hypothetical protein
MQVMYVPQPKQLTHGGFFQKHEASGMWDTAECAKLMMHYLVAGNPIRVDDVISPKSGHSIRQLVEAALKNKEASEVVDTFLEVKAAVAGAPDSLVGVPYTVTYMDTWMSQEDMALRLIGRGVFCARRGGGGGGFLIARIGTSTGFLGIVLNPNFSQGSDNPVSILGKIGKLGHQALW